MRLLGVVACICLVAFFFHFAIQAGLTGPMRWANFGPGETAEAVPLPDGRYAILVRGFRIQIYSSNVQFLYGWNTCSFEGTLRSSADGNLNLYLTNRTREKDGKWEHAVYDVNGTLLSRAFDGDDPASANLPGRGGQLIHVPDGSRWWLFPLWNPFSAMGSFLAVFLVAIVLSFALFTREERQAHRQRLRAFRPGVRVDDQPGFIRIRWRWFGRGTVCATLFCIIFDAVVIHWYMTPWTDPPALIILKHIIVFGILVGTVVLTYGVLCGYFNSTKIILNRSELIITRGPLPCGGNRRLSLDHIQQLYSERTFVPASLSQGGRLRGEFIPGRFERNRGWTSTLNARLANGTVVQLLGLQTPDLAEFLRFTLEQKLWTLRKQEGKQEGGQDPFSTQRRYA